MDIPQDIQQDFDDHKNELVILCDLSIGRLIDVKNETEDIYWKIKKMHDEIEYYSCVMGFIPLKGEIPKKDYSRINGVFKLNVSDE